MWDAEDIESLIAHALRSEVACPDYVPEIADHSSFTTWTCAERYGSLSWWVSSD